MWRRRASRRLSPAATSRRYATPGGSWDELGQALSWPGAASPSQPFWNGGFRPAQKSSSPIWSNEKTSLEWQGAQLLMIGFDELTHFSAAQFWSMVACNCSPCCGRPADPSHRNLDADKLGRRNDRLVERTRSRPAGRRAAGRRCWVVSAGRERRHGGGWPRVFVVVVILEPAPAVVDFGPAWLEDNKALTAADPAYRAKLLALPRVERERLLHGNWKIRPAAGPAVQPRLVRRGGRRPRRPHRQARSRGPGRYAQDRKPTIPTGPAP